MLNVNFGYPGGNVTLAQKGIRINRSLKLAEGDIFMKRCLKKAGKNLDDLLKILIWNEKKGIKFFRINSEIFPHITNWRCLAKTDILDYKALVYDITQFTDKIKLIGKYAKEHGHRLTFHPLPYVILNSINHFIFISSLRDLWWHTLFIEIAKLENSSITIHLGGIYNNKYESILRFIENFNTISARIKKHIIIENDEFKFSINDIIYVSKQFTPPIPICFDYFHYICYNKYILQKNIITEPQFSLKKVFKNIKISWDGRKPKMHLSSQSKGKRLGTHSNTFKKIPSDLIPFLKNIDVMLETKNKELTVITINSNYF